MRVFYVARQAAGPVVYQAKRVTFCCGEMNRWWGRLSSFGVRDCRASTSPDVNLFLTHPQANGKTGLEVVPVQCCPWCGEAFAVCRAK